MMNAFVKKFVRTAWVRDLGPARGGWIIDMEGVQIKFHGMILRSEAKALATEIVEAVKARNMLEQHAPNNSAASETEK